MSDSFLAGMAGGIAASGDSRKATRRLFSLVSVVGAALALCFVVWMYVSTGGNVASYAIGALFWGWVVVVAVAKWVCAFPFSVFRLVPLAISAAKRGIAARVWFIALGAAWILGIVFAAALSLPGVIFCTIALFIAAWGSGAVIGKVEGQLWKQMEAARIVVARAINYPPESLESTWSGKIHAPLFTFQFPRVFETHELAAVGANFMSLQSPFVIQTIADRGVDVAPSRK